MILDQSLKYGESQSRWRREAVALKRPEQRDLIARVVPVEGEARALLDGAALVILLIDPEDCPQPSFAILRQVFDLTRAEARIATELLSGRSLDDIAKAANVSIGTVRSQTKAVFAKTQTNRQGN